MTFCAFIPEHSGHVIVCVVNVVHFEQSEIQSKTKRLILFLLAAQYQSQLLGPFL